MTDGEDRVADPVAEPGLGQDADEPKQEEPR